MTKRIRKLVVLLLSLLLIVLASSICYGADYYVDPAKGNNAYDGLAPDYMGGVKGPKQTIGSFSRTAKAGDTVHLRGGIYGEGQGWFTNKNLGNDGTPDKPITIKRYLNEEPVFNGKGLYDVVFTIARNWVVLDGITFDTCKGANIVILLEGSNNIIRNNTVRNTSTFIRLDNGSNNLITNNKAENIGDNGKGLGAGEFLFIRGGENNEVAKNKINGAGHAAIMLIDYPNYQKLSRFNKIRNNVIDQKNGGGGIYAARGSSYNLIEGNTIKNVGQMEGITQNKAGIFISAPNNSVRRNIIVNYGVKGDESHRGIMLAASSPLDNKDCTGNLIYNNVILGGYGLPVYYREGVGGREKGYVVKDNVFANNIIYNAPIEQITGVNYIGMYTPAGHYSIYIGIYTGGAWDSFANGNVFMNNLIFNKHGIYAVGYYYGSGGWSLSVEQAQKKFPGVFSGNIYDVDPNIKSIWWRPKATDATVDAGRFIDDVNGTVGGWKNLRRCGTAPDIGAREVCKKTQ